MSIAAINQAYMVWVITSFVISWLVWPSAIASSIALTIKSYKTKQLFRSLPLLATQFNSAFIWSCLACDSVGKFYHEITGKRMLSGYFYGFRNDVVTTLLLSAIYLAPLNIFLYSWSFLAALEEEEKKSCVRKMYRWFAFITIFLLPLGFYAVYTAYVIVAGKFLNNLFEKNPI